MDRGGTRGGECCLAGGGGGGGGAPWSPERCPSLSLSLRKRGGSKKRGEGSQDFSRRKKGKEIVSVKRGPHTLLSLLLLLLFGAISLFQIPPFSPPPPPSPDPRPPTPPISRVVGGVCGHVVRCFCGLGLSEMSSFVFSRLKY